MTLRQRRAQPQLRLHRFRQVHAPFVLLHGLDTHQLTQPPTAAKAIDVDADQARSEKSSRRRGFGPMEEGTFHRIAHQIFSVFPVPGERPGDSKEAGQLLLQHQLPGSGVSSHTALHDQ